MTLSVMLRPGAWHWHAPEALTAREGDCAVWVRGTVIDGSARWNGANAARELLRRYREDGGWARAAGLHGTFSAVLADEGRRRALVLTDRLGTRPVYYRRLEEGWRISDDAWQAMPERPACDPEAALDLLFFGFVPGSRTLERDTFECLNRRLYEFRCEPPAVSATAYWEPRLTGPNDGPEAEWRPRMREALEALMRCTQEALAVRRETAHLLLSGGLDTRVLVAALSAPGTAVAAYSYGVGADEDLRYAAAIAQRLGWRHTVRQVTDAELLGLRWASLTAALGLRTQAVAGLGVALLAGAMGPAPGPVVTGFGGDLLSGSFLHGAFREPAGQRIWRMFGRFVDFSALVPAMRPGIAELAQRRRAAVEEQLLAADPESAVHAWNIDERQRRLILPQFDVPGRETVYPFAEPSFLEACFQAPRALLRGQRLYRNTLYYEVFTGAHAWLRQMPLVKYHYGVPFHPVAAGWGRWRFAVPELWSSFHYYKQRLGWSGRPVELYHFWRDQPGFRRAVLERFEGSPVLGALFDPGRLRAALAEDRGYLLAAGGIWSLMTLAAWRWDARPAAVPEGAHAAATS